MRISSCRHQRIRKLCRVLLNRTYRSFSFKFVKQRKLFKAKKKKVKVCLSIKEKLIRKLTNVTVQSSVVSIRLPIEWLLGLKTSPSSKSLILLTPIMNVKCNLSGFLLFSLLR